ncbi:MAG: orotidine-5'-phosphate decarboxylase [Clostridia bacterium]|nr:orotidine-5'-phosphate decarboxylase [Clostridia bacterium]MDE7328964.1 orotidine-5'-phosphate decarboxylase [Clostridia bacterium]
MIIDKLIDRIKETDNPSVIGLDTCIDYLPDEMRSKCVTLKEAASQIAEFNFDLIDALKDVIPAVKVQIAYYEMYGVDGFLAFRDTVKYARESGLLVISDIKRNDIGSTASAYSKAHIGKTVLADGSEVTPFETDFITVNGYLGSDGILPFVADCKKYDKGAFALVKTSNPTSGELQDRTMDDGRTLYDNMASLVDTWGKELIGKYGYSSIGAVVGATHAEQAKLIRKAHPNTFFLIPGYGAQGGKAEDLAVCFENGIGGIVNSSRGILCAYRKDAYRGLDYREAALKACLDMKEDINKYIK